MDPVPPQPGDSERTLRQTAFALAGVGMTLAVAALSGAALGWFVDSKLDSTPIGILLGLVLGLACGIVAIWREVRTYLGN
jgi:F0F1-type ATP synthase assembly protein I